MFVATYAGALVALGWWGVFINFGYCKNYSTSFSPVFKRQLSSFSSLGLYSIAECFAFIVCTKWSNPVIHSKLNIANSGSSSTSVRYLDWNGGLVVSQDEDQDPGGLCGLQNLGGHIMKIPIITFQVLVCMRLEVTVLTIEFREASSNPLID